MITSGSVAKNTLCLYILQVVGHPTSCFLPSPIATGFHDAVFRIGITLLLDLCPWQQSWPWPAGENLVINNPTPSIYYHNKDAILNMYKITWEMLRS